MSEKFHVVATSLPDLVNSQYQNAALQSLIVILIHSIIIMIVIIIIIIIIIIFIIIIIISTIIRCSGRSSGMATMREFGEQSKLPHYPTHSTEPVAVCPENVIIIISVITIIIVILIIIIISILASHLSMHLCIYIPILNS